MVISKDTRLIEFLKSSYAPKLWFQIILLLGLLLGLMLAWPDLISGDWLSVVVHLIITPIWLYGLHLVSHILFWVPWFYLMRLFAPK